MWYKASSVVAAIEQCGGLSVTREVPSCPKKGNNIHCHQDFPDCEGKMKNCEQSLNFNNQNGNPIILYFTYFLDKNDRDGRIKKKNSTLLMIINKYHIDENLMVSV
jgi:hypothetical protein